MTMKNLMFDIMKKISPGILLISLLLICVMNSVGQSKKCDLLDRKITLHVSQGTFVYTLGKLAQDYEIPLGLEKSVKHTDEAKININVEEKSLRDVLNLLMEQEPEYKWELTNNVLNFTPNRNRNEFLSTFLNLPVSQIVYPKENDGNSLRETILALPEVAQLMKSKGVKYAEYMNDPSFQPLFSKENLNPTASNITIKDFLNQVIRYSDHKTWVVEMVGKNKDKLLISF